MTTPPMDRISPIFVPTADAVEESIWNAMGAAETMTGFRARTVYAVPLDAISALV